jgi:hypothetical protein
VEMSFQFPVDEPELKAFLRRFGTRRRAPAKVRQRALANARTIATADGTISRSPRPAPSPVVLRRHPSLRWVLACSVLALGGIAAFAAFRGPPDRESRVVASSGGKPSPAIPVEQGAPVAQPPAVPVPGPLPVRPGQAPVAEVSRNVLPAEIDLLRRARSAYSRREFSATLRLVAEHARRFPQGYLAEEREGLRVRSLIGAGRPAEARRATEAFAIRFPRSVLLSRLREESDSGR